MAKRSQLLAKRGRDQLLEDEDLFKRYGALRFFLEFNWGRVGLKLQKVRKPADVSSAIKLVPRFESLPAFRDHNGLCFSNQGSGPVGFRELRNTQRMHREADAAKDRRWSEFHNTGQKLESAKNILKIVTSEFAPVASFAPIFKLIFAIAFNVGQLHQEFEAAQLTLNTAREEEEKLRKKKAAQEAWFAQNQILQLRRSKRRSLDDPDKLAKAMAGMPEYGWFNSFRRCDKLDVASFAPALVLGPDAYPYQLFKIVREITKRMKPLKVERVKTRLLQQLRNEENSLLRECVKPHWIHMQRAFDDCRGKRFTRRELPYLLIGKFLDRMESGMSSFDSELAKLAEAELTVQHENH